VKLSKQLEGQAGGQPKIWGPVAHPGLPLEPPLLMNTMLRFDTTCLLQTEITAWLEIFLCSQQVSLSLKKIEKIKC